MKTTRFTRRLARTLAFVCAYLIVMALSAGIIFGLIVLPLWVSIIGMISLVFIGAWFLSKETP